MAQTSSSSLNSPLALDLDVIVEVALPSHVDVDALDDLLRFVLSEEGRNGSWEIALLFTTDERLQTLHRDFMGIDAPTDVMTFPRAEGESMPVETQGGDIVVSVERAIAQAAEYGYTPALETRFLVLHGLLHLCAWDDTSDADRIRMLERQAALLQAFDRQSSME